MAIPSHPWFSTSRSGSTFRSFRDFWNSDAIFQPKHLLGIWKSHIMKEEKNCHKCLFLFKMMFSFEFWKGPFGQKNEKTRLCKASRSKMSCRPKKKEDFSRKYYSWDSVVRLNKRKGKFQFWFWASELKQLDFSCKMGKKGENQKTTNVPKQPCKQRQVGFRATLFTEFKKSRKEAVKQRSGEGRTDENGLLVSNFSFQWR